MIEETSTASSSELLFKQIVIAMLVKERLRTLKVEALWRKKNPEKLKAYKQREAEKDIEKLRARARRYYHTVSKFKKRVRKWTPESKEKHRKLASRWRSNNMGRVRELGRIQQRRFRADPVKRIISLFRTRINRYARKPSRSPMWTLLGCNCEAFRAHIEKQFSVGMNWSNYGRGEGKWVVDHRIPVSSFDHSIPDNVAKCWNHSNLQPLWWIDNLRKRAHYTPELAL